MVRTRALAALALALLGGHGTAPAAAAQDALDSRLAASADGARPIEDLHVRLRSEGGIAALVHRAIEIDGRRVRVPSTTPYGVGDRPPPESAIAFDLTERQVRQLARHLHECEFAGLPERSGMSVADGVTTVVEVEVGLALRAIVVEQQRVPRRVEAALAPIVALWEIAALGLPQQAPSVEDEVEGLEIRVAASPDAADDAYFFELAVTNPADEPATLNFSSGQQYDFEVTRGDREVFRWSHDRFFTQALTSRQIGPGDTWRIVEVWDGRNNEGDALPAGDYELYGRLPATDPPLRNERFGPAEFRWPPE